TCWVPFGAWRLNFEFQISNWRTILAKGAQTPRVSHFGVGQFKKIVVFITHVKMNLSGCAPLLENAFDAMHRVFKFERARLDGIRKTGIRFDAHDGSKIRRVLETPAFRCAESCQNPSGFVHSEKSSSEESPMFNLSNVPRTRAWEPTSDHSSIALLTSACSLMMQSRRIASSMMAPSEIDTYGPTIERRICAPGAKYTGGIMRDSSALTGSFPFLPSKYRFVCKMASRVPQSSHTAMRSTSSLAPCSIMRCIASAR